MKEYLKPLIEDEVIEIEDIIADSNLSTQEAAPVVGGSGDDNVEYFS